MADIKWHMLSAKCWIVQFIHQEDTGGLGAEIRYADLRVSAWIWQFSNISSHTPACSTVLPSNITWACCSITEILFKRREPNSFTCSPWRGGRVAWWLKRSPIRFPNGYNVWSPHLVCPPWSCWIIAKGGVWHNSRLPLIVTTYYQNKCRPL